MTNGLRQSDDEPARRLPARIAVLEREEAWLVPSLATAIVLVAGIHAAERWSDVRPGVFALLCGLFAATSWRLDRRRASRRASVAILIAMFCLGGARWSARLWQIPVSDIRNFAISEDETIRLNGSICNIPSLRSRRESAWGSRGGEPARQTEFLLRVQSLPPGDASSSLLVSGTVRVLIDGDATGLFRWGDRATVTGKLSSSFDPENPGEFDYGQFLDRQSISGLMFVRHPLAVFVAGREPGWHPRTLLSNLRTAAAAMIRTGLDADHQPVAEALLLGNRGHLDPALERDFIASGTMHLLAISGLHVGVLYVFLIRLCGVLLISRHRALMIGLACCVVYAFLTDLRPSVLRATGFMALAVAGQLCNRGVRMPTLIGTTTTVCLLFDPGIAFDTGAWLSFLCVAALAWATSWSRPDADNREAPPESITLRERLAEFGAALRSRLAGSYAQMFAITACSMPIVASQFHVVSASGIIVNIALIPLSGIAMISGFVFLGTGLLIPSLAFVPGFVFERCLGVLNWCVARAADASFGDLMLADIPNGFIAAWYIVLVIAIVLPHRLARRFAWAVLATMIVVGFWLGTRRPETNGLVATVLSVGHGNAVVVETPDRRVLVFDAGALNRGERTSETVSRFLWHRGFRMIDSLVISHADADHYNAVTGLVDRMPIGEVITTRDFVRSTDEPIAGILQLLSDHRISVRLAYDGDGIACGSARVRFLSAAQRFAVAEGETQEETARGDETPHEEARGVKTSGRDFHPDDSALDDNERSLVAVVEYAGRRLCLPGDLEKRGTEQLAARLPVADMLVSPHHGSLTSNTPLTALTIRPNVVVVSSRTDAHDEQLQQIYGTQTRFFNTAVAGAVTIAITSDGQWTVESFRGARDQSATHSVRRAASSAAMRTAASIRRM